MKQLLASLLALALCLLAGCGLNLARYPKVEPSSPVIEPQTLTIDLPQDAGPVTLSAVNQLGSALLELSDGAITLEIVSSSDPAGALAHKATHLALLENQDLIEADPSMGFLDWPFLMADAESYLTVMGAENGAVRGSASLREALGGEIIGLWYSGRTVLLGRGTFYPEIAFSGVSLGTLKGREGSGFFEGMEKELRAGKVYTDGPDELLNYMKNRTVKFLEYPLDQLDGENPPQELKYLENTAHRVGGAWLVLGEEAVDKETAQIIRAAAAYVPQSVFTTCIRQEEELFQALEAQGVQVRQGDYTILNRAAREYFRKNYQELGMSQRAWEQILPVIS